jgi:hypothetical protein
LVGHHADHPLWHPKVPEDWCLIEFLSLFFMCFRGLALVESEVGRIFHDFTRLPEYDLIEAARGLGIASDRIDVAVWKKTLDARGQKALVAALYTSEWAYYAEHEPTGWWFASPTGLAMLGLGPPPPMPDLATVFRVQPDLSVFAGAGLGRETLVPLFRHATIKRIDQVYEFRLDRERLAGTPSAGSPGEELREVFRALDPLPPPSRTCWPRRRRWAARSASAGAARWSSPRAPRSWRRSVNIRSSRAISSREPRPVTC